MNFLDDCRRLVGLDSTPSHGNLAAAEFVGRLCEQAGLHVEYQKEFLDGIDQCNVVARPRPGGPVAGEFLLQTHLDTVEAGHFSQWTRTQSNPFNASIYEDVIYGLGTADTKLDVLCKIEAIKRVLGRPLKRPFVLAATYGAQNGMTGAIKLIRRKKISATQAIIGVPTSLKLATSGSGLAVVEITIPFSDEESVYRRDHDLMESTTSQSRIFSGRAAHSSDPGRGENAIMKMLEYLSQLPTGIAIMDLSGGVNHNSVPSDAFLEIDTVAAFREPILPKIREVYRGLLQLETELHAFREEGLEPPHPTMNLGMVRTTDTYVRLTGSCRLPPSVTDGTYQAWMNRLAETVQSVGATFRVRDYRGGFTTDLGSAFVTEARAALKGVALDDEPIKLPLASEANVFSRMGVECLVWGPGQSVGNSHAPNESVKIGDLKIAVEFYTRLLERVCV